MEKIDRFAQDRGLETDRVQALSLHVGLPWVYSASLCGDDDLQNKWAELFLSLGTETDSEHSAGATYVRILAELDSWDCRVLDYMANRGGLSKTLFRDVLFWDELLESVDTLASDPGRTLLSVEKLVRCGCLHVRDAYPLRQDGGISIYGGIQRRVALTITGLKFYIAVTGDEPDWLSRDDEYRDDIHPIHPTLERSGGKGD